MTQKQKILGIVLALLVPAAVWAGDLVLPHVFAGGQPIRASEFNANFEALRAAIAAQQTEVGRLREQLGVTSQSDGGAFSVSGTEIVTLTESDFLPPERLPDTCDYISPLAETNNADVQKVASAFSQNRITSIFCRASRKVVSNSSSGTFTTYPNENMMGSHSIRRLPDGRKTIDDVLIAGSYMTPNALCGTTTITISDVSVVCHVTVGGGLPDAGVDGGP